MLSAEGIELRESPALRRFKSNTIRPYTAMGNMTQSPLQHANEGHILPQNRQNIDRLNNSDGSKSPKRKYAAKPLKLVSPTQIGDGTLPKERILLVKNGIPVSCTTTLAKSQSEKERITPTVHNTTTSIIATTGLPYNLNNSPKGSLLSNPLTQAHLAVALKKRQDESHSECKTEINKLKSLVLHHIELIEQQQQTIKEKDKLVSELRDENQALQNRLGRMNRRVKSPLAGNAQAANDDNPISSPRSKTDKLNENNNAQTTPNLPSSTKRSKGSMKKVPNTSKRANIPQTLVPQASTLTDDILLVEKEFYTEQVHLFEEQHDDSLPDMKEQRAIEVPTFRLLVDDLDKVQLVEVTSDNEVEECDDQSYLRRHLRHEIEERRRKRWDRQRLRERQMVENLKKNHTANRFSIPSTTERNFISKIFPSVENAKFLEINEMLPVNVFGLPIPTLKEQAFKLPWYKPKSNIGKRPGKKRKKK